MLRLLPLAIALAWACTACSSDVVGAGDGSLRGRLTLTGSSTMAPLLSEIGQRFEAVHPDLRVDVQTGGSGRGIADVASGLANIGMSSRALTADEREGRTEHAFASDGVGFVVHSSNPVAQLSNEQLRAIFTGVSTDWSDVGGRPGPITVIDRARGRSEVSLVTDYLQIAGQDIVPDVVGGENLHVVKQVAMDPNAIAYLSIGTAEVTIQLGSELRLLALSGVTASAANVANGSYPLARPLLLLTGTNVDARVDAFLEFVNDPSLHTLIREHAFVPLAR